VGRDTFHWTRLLKALSNLALNTARQGTSTASLGNLENFPFIQADGAREVCVGISLSRCCLHASILGLTKFVVLMIAVPVC